MPFDSSNEQLYNFDTRDGLPNNSLPGFLAKGRNGYMYAGALGYIIRFKPAALLHRYTSGGAQFSEITVMNDPIPIIQEKSGKTVINLDGGKAVFSVDFCVMNYDNIAGNRYYYWLEGGMTNWTENENGHLSFYNLPNGNYILHVKGGNKYGGHLTERHCFIST